MSSSPSRIAAVLCRYGRSAPRSPIKSLRQLAEAEADCTRCPLYRERDAGGARRGSEPRRPSCWSASSRATRKISPASRSSARPGAFSTGRWRSRHRAQGNFRHQRGEAFQARDARQAPAAQAAEQLRDRALQDLARRERKLVKPSTIIALGVTAARSLTGKTRDDRQSARQAADTGGRHQAYRHRASVRAAAHRGRRRQARRLSAIRRRSESGRGGSDENRSKQ